jgi:hypothetical protein
MTLFLRRLIGAAVALAAPALVLITYAALRDRLPDPLAIHWDLHGRVDNTASVAGFFTGTLIAAGVLALGSLAATYLAHSPIAGRMLGSLLTFGAWIAASGWAVTAAVSTGAAHAADVDMPWYLVALLIAAPILLGIVTWLVLPGTWQHPDAPTPGSTLTFAPGEAVVWVDHASMAWGRWVAAVAAVAAVVLFWIVRPASVPLAIVAVALTLTSELAVRVDARGVHTLWGPFGWPRSHISLGQISAARAERIEPLQWGGWGYRVSTRGVAAVIRRGPGLVISRAGRPDYAVTIPHAAAGADVLNALLARESAAADPSA